MKKPRKLRKSDVHNRTLLLALLIMTSVLTVVLAPGIRLQLWGPVSSLSLINSEKPIVQYGAFSFTVGDLAFVISLVAASFTIALFVEAMKRRKS